MKEPGKYESCVCGKDAKAKFCCLKGGYWRVESRGLILPGVKTETVVDGCYAACTNDCGGRISREHLYSEGILRVVTSEGVDHKVIGLSRNSESPVSLRPKAVAVLVLCQRHNNALSNYDDTARSVYSFLRKLDQDFASSSPTDDFLLVSGEDFEYWLLKTTCVQMTSGRLRVKGKPYQSSPPEIFVSLLFQGLDWPQGWGMYLIDPPEGACVLANNYISFCLVWREDDLIGASFIFGGHYFYLQLDDFTPYPRGGHRPYSMSFLHPDGKTRKLSFSWPSSEGRDFLQRYTGQTDELPTDKF